MLRLERLLILTLVGGALVAIIVAIFEWRAPPSTGIVSTGSKRLRYIRSSGCEPSAFEAQLVPQPDLYKQTGLDHLLRQEQAADWVRPARMVEPLTSRDQMPIEQREPQRPKHSRRDIRHSCKSVRKRRRSSVALL
ncbi:hypothetical protein [Bradyrhizobium sp. USDA 4486]